MVPQVKELVVLIDATQYSVALVNWVIGFNPFRAQSRVKYVPNTMPTTSSRVYQTSNLNWTDDPDGPMLIADTKGGHPRAMSDDSREDAMRIASNI